MQSSKLRFLLALSVLLGSWVLTSLPIVDVYAGGDDDDSAGDDDDTSGDDDAGDDDDASGDDDAGDDDDSADDDALLGGPEVPFEDRELGGGCACSSQGNEVAADFAPTLMLLAGLVLLRRRYAPGA